MPITMMHARKAARLIGSSFKVDVVTARAQAEIGVFTFGPDTKTPKATVAMQQIQYVTSKKTAVVPASELYEPSEPDALKLAELRYRS
jgi:hypothetical protein